MTKFILLCAALVALTGCVGVPSSGSVATVVATDYVPVNETENVISTIAGIGFVQELAREGTSNTFAQTNSRYVSLNGQYNHGEAQVTLDDGFVTVVDERDTNAFEGRDLSGYQYTGIANQSLAPMVGDAIDTDLRVSSSLVFGIPTRRADTAFLAGTAVYTGDAILNYENVNGAVSYRSDARVRANFDTARVNVTITPEADVGPDAAFDTFVRRNMVISGAGFSGGYAEFTQDGAPVDPIGRMAQSFAKGRFFGPVSGIPAEVGGVIHINGPAGELSTTFIAR